MEEFNAGVLDGRSWCIYNNCVIDIGTYQYEHPGGKFLFTSCIGHDLGHYLDGSATNVEEGKPHEHSHSAYVITRRLVIARLLPTTSETIFS